MKTATQSGLDGKKSNRQTDELKVRLTDETECDAKIIDLLIEEISGISIMA